jgi:multidrug resistance efflux pump
MPPAKLLIGGAGAALGIRVARTMYAHWRVLPDADRRRLEPLAEETKHRALEVRGATDLERATADLRAASETLAAALVESAESDPELDVDEVSELREELRRELARLATADIKASRSPREHGTPPG